ncbi:cerv family protein [Megaselia abdita]
MTSILDYINENVDIALKDLIRAAEIAAQIGTEDEKNPTKFITSAEQILEVKRDAKISEKALELCNEADSIEGVEDILRDAKAEASSSNRVSQSALKEFKQNINRILGGHNISVVAQDMDLNVTQSAFNDIDPITKRKIEHPVVNKICGHIYDKASVLEAISLNKRMRCPVIGCGNNKHVAKSHIVDDPAQIQKIRLSQQETMDITL